MVVLAMIFAMVGAPANTHFVCDPSMQVGHGYTWWSEAPSTIHVATEPCGALLYASANARERYLITQWNASQIRDWTVVVGRGLLLVTHEAFHAAGQHDECLAQRSAMELLPTILARVLPDEVSVKQAMRAAEFDDALWGPAYHGC